MKSWRDYLREIHPFTGRFIGDDGALVNLADFVNWHPQTVARGLNPNAQPFSAYGERIVVGAETNTPIWPDGIIRTGPIGGVQLYAKSSSANDTVGGSGMGYLSVHYLDEDRVDTDATIPLAGLTQVALPTKAMFIQCAHTGVEQAKVAAGTITIVDGSGNVYSQIDVGEPRCSSSFRMVPKGTRLFIDGAVGSSTSATSDTASRIRIVANELFDHQYIDPLLFMPVGSISLQNNAIAFAFPVALGPFREGSVVGAIHSSNKACTVGVTWFGRLETVS